MRQVFSSARLENVEAVAELLREDGIEVRISDGRSYKGNRRSTMSYSETEGTRPAVWIVRTEDLTRARELLRQAGLVDSTRGMGPTLSFRSEFDATTKSPLQRRTFRIKVGLLLAIAVAIGVGMYRTGTAPTVVELASPPFDGSRQATLVPVAHAVFEHELGAVDTPVICLGVDGADATRTVRDVLRPPEKATIVPVSHCQQIASEDYGSVHPPSKQPATIVEVSNFRPTAADAGTVEYSAYHHRMWARYKTLEVRRIDGRWRVVRTIKHVAT